MSVPTRTLRLTILKIRPAATGDGGFEVLGAESARILHVRAADAARAPWWRLIVDAESARRALTLQVHEDGRIEHADD